MAPSALLSRPRALAGFAFVTLLCIISRVSSLNVFSSLTLPGRVEPIIKRTWQSEQGPFWGGPPEDSVAEEEGGPAGEVDKSASDNPERLGIPGLGNPLPPLNSIVASVLGASAVTVPVPGLPTLPLSSDNLFSSVISVLAGAPTAVPTGAGGNGGALGGLLSALSQVTPASVVPTGSTGLLPAFDVLGGVAAALDNALGSSEDDDGFGDGILGQLSTKITAPIASIAADPAPILADPSAALDNLQSQVSSLLDSLPSAVAVGMQLTNNVGGQIADALGATTELLDSAPDVAAGVVDQVGSLLNAAPDLATGLPAAALSAVNQVESILTADADVVGDVAGILGGLKEELSSAIVNAAPEVTSLAAAVGAHVVDSLPPVIQGPVQGVLSSLQNDVSGLLCQVSDVVSGTAIIFNVPCSSISSIITSATAPAVASASITVGEPLPFVPTPTSSILRSPLASVLSYLRSSISTADSTGASAVDPAASSALSGLSSLFSQISELSLTAADTPSAPLAPPTVPLSQSASSNQVAETTIYQVRTITAFITSTAVQTSTVTQCAVAASSGILGGLLPAPSPPDTGTGPSVPGADTRGPCPDYGYTCDDCPNGWFCPPVQTPAWPAPCGYGWPCYHCESGWFCVPSPESTASLALLASRSISSVVIPTSLSATKGYLYAGCYADDSTRVLRKAEVLDLREGMTNEHCIEFCQKQGLLLAGTEHGAQCFCDDVVFGSALLSPDHCNVTCTGDLTNSTVCGGSWAISVWSLDGTAPQEPNSTSLANTIGHYGPGAERELPGSVKTPIYAGPRYSPQALGVAGLQSSAAHTEVHGVLACQPANASSVMQGIASILDTGLPSAASDLKAAPETSKATRPDSSGFFFGLDHVVSDNFVAVNPRGVASDETDAASEGDIHAAAPPLTPSLKNKRRAPRGKARWL